MKYILLSSLVVLSVFSTYVSAQDCKPPAIVFNAKTENIFTPEQEMYLGDAMMERVQKDYRVIDDAAVNAYLQAIGERIAKHLPPSGINFRFTVVDTPDTNAFAMAGGRIMVTRKLISFVRSEDELAGVIGHELGHAVVRHHAIDLSRYFKLLLGVTSVGDRQDVFEKYNRFLETSQTKRVSFSNDHENNQQLEADRIGVFAVYAAGYDPNATVAFWQRLTDAKKIGFFGSLFGGSRPADKRLTEMTNALKTISSACLDKLSSTTKTDFDAWRNFVIGYSGLGARESLAGLIFKKSLVPLRSDIQHLRFSPDGKYIIAQDSSTVTVLKRDPLSVAFKVEVEDAFPATFSPDSTSLIVYNRNLRVQKWNIATKELISTYEIAVRGDYWQTRISPDGNYVACYRYNGDLVIFDVKTNDEIFKEKEFYLPTEAEYYTWRFSQDLLDIQEFPALNMEFSQDSRYFLAGRKSFSARFGAGSFGFTKEHTIAIDLPGRKKISIGENVKKLLLTSMDFIGSDKVVGQFGDDVKKSGIFSFPQGDRIAEFELAGTSFMAGFSGNYMTVRPVTGAAVGLYDLTQKKFLFGNGKSALDVYDDTFVVELKDGEIGLFKTQTRELLSAVALPASPFGSLRATALSADGNWLVVSDRSRGAAWDLRTGERKIHSRAFRGAFITPDAKVFADFPKQGKNERSIGVMDLQTGSVSPLGDMPADTNISQFGKYLLVRRSLNEEKEKPKTDGDKKEDFKEEPRDRPLARKGTTLEMREVNTGRLLWKRDFLDERPGIGISSINDTMLFGWALDSAAANQIINASPALREKRQKMGSKEGDLLIELVNPQTGEIKGEFLLETGEGSFAPENFTWAGDFLIINDNRNRILVFSSSNGDLLSRFFGNYAIASPQTKQIAIENSPGRVTISDITTGREVTKLSFLRPVSLMRFLDSGRKLFVLTSDQTAFMFDTTKFGLLAQQLEPR